MEPETISKNGASLKSQMSKKNQKPTLIKKLLLFMVLCIPFFANGQSATEMYREMDANRSMISKSDNWVSYTKVYEAHGKSKKWLYDKLVKPPGRYRQCSVLRKLVELAENCPFAENRERKIHCKEKIITFA